MSRRDRGRGSRARRGERLAALFLRLKGYRVEARNWRCPLGELDLVCRQRGTLVFVEVKTRRGRSAEPPEDAVDRRKQEQLARLAEAYMASREVDDVACRFDVIAIEEAWPVPRLRHLRDAFRADDLVG